MLLSRIGRLPPVVRLWASDGSDGTTGRWQARHMECMHVR